MGVDPVREDTGSTVTIEDISKSPNVVVGTVVIESGNTAVVKPDKPTPGRHVTVVVVGEGTLQVGEVQIFVKPADKKEPTEPEEPETPTGKNYTLSY